MPSQNAIFVDRDFAGGRPPDRLDDRSRLFAVQEPGSRSQIRSFVRQGHGLLSGGDRRTLHGVLRSTPGTDESVDRNPISVYDFIGACQSHNSAAQETSLGLHVYRGGTHGGRLS
jgi:hypothetical protein